MNYDDVTVKQLSGRLEDFTDTLVAMLKAKDKLNEFFEPTDYEFKLDQENNMLVCFFGIFSVNINSVDYVIEDMNSLYENGKHFEEYKKEQEKEQMEIDIYQQAQSVPEEREFNIGGEDKKFIWNGNKWSEKE